MGGEKEEAMEEEADSSGGLKMGGDPIPGPFDILRECFELDKKKGKERARAEAKLRAWLKKKRSRK